MTDRPSLPLVSICVITYNHEKYIAQTLDCILSQKTKYPYHIIIGEDCSTDGTRKICETYAARYTSITLLPSEKNVGISANFLRTLQACHGEYVAICEGDDYWTDNEKIEIQIDFLCHHRDFALCFHSVGVDADGKIRKNTFVKAPASETTAADLARSNYIFTPSVVYRSASISLNHLQNTYATVYDYVVWMECAVRGKLKYINREMANYRLHETNRWATYNRAARLFTWLEIIYSLEKQHPALGPEWKINKQSTIAVFLDDLYENDGLQKLNEVLFEHQDEALLLSALKDRIVQLKSSTSYRLGRKLIRWIDSLLLWRKEK